MRYCIYLRYVFSPNLMNYKANDIAAYKLIFKNIKRFIKRIIKR